MYRALGNITAQTLELEQYRKLHEANQERMNLVARGPLSPLEVMLQTLDPGER